jgi:hypothetical protein
VNTARPVSRRGRRESTIADFRETGATHRLATNSEIPLAAVYARRSAIMGRRTI